MRDKEVIWLTGASSGIGAAVAKEAAKRGYKLVLTARRGELLEELATTLRNLPGVASQDILSISADVTDGDAIKRCVSTATAHFGKIDILLANAGTSYLADPEQLSTEGCEQLFQINFFGVIRCIETILPQMIERGRGHIVAVSSVAGYRGLPRAAPYCASKSALTTFLESLRFDLKPKGVAVSIVSPGFVKTPLTDKNDFEMPFLISPEVAAVQIMNGIRSKRMEIHFPKRFTYLLKLMRIIPFPLYNLLVGWKTKP